MSEETDNVFQGWLEKYDEQPPKQDYRSPRTGIVDTYQARFDDMKEAFEAGVWYGSVRPKL